MKQQNKIFIKGGEFEENQEEEFLNFSGKKIER